MWATETPIDHAQETALLDCFRYRGFAENGLWKARFVSPGCVVGSFKDTRHGFKLTPNRLIFMEFSARGVQPIYLNKIKPPRYLVDAIWSPYDESWNPM